MNEDQGKIEKQLIINYRAGDNGALSELFQNNKNLIEIIYEKFFNKSGCPKEDMCQEGYLGLLEAVKRIDVDQYGQYTFYKTLWIKKKMFSFRSKFFKIRTTPIGNEQLALEWEQPSSEKMKYALFELDNLVKAGKMPKIKAEKLLNKIIKGTK